MTALPRLLQLDHHSDGLTPGRGSIAPQDLLVFGAVAREGGVRRAAAALGVPRSTISRQLAGLERSVGSRLVSRSTRTFMLTELGQALLEQCSRLEEVMAATDGVVARAAGAPSGTLKVAASPVVGEEFLPEVLSAYLERFPGTRIDIELAVSYVDLKRGGVDVAVRTGPLEESGELYAVPLGQSVKGLYASRAYLQQHGTPETPDALARHACIVVGSGRSAVWSFKVRSHETHLAVSGPLRVDSYRLARSAAAEGVGIARLPTSFAKAMVASRELVPLLEETWQRATLYAVHAAGRPAPPKIRAFIELLKEVMKKHLA